MQWQQVIYHDSLYTDVSLHWSLETRCVVVCADALSHTLDGTVVTRQARPFHETGDPAQAFVYFHLDCTLRFGVEQLPSFVLLPTGFVVRVCLQSQQAQFDFLLRVPRASNLTKMCVHV